MLYFSMALLIDAPWETNFSASAMRDWIQLLNDWLEEHKADPGALAAIHRELADAAAGLAALEQRERDGLPPLEDDDAIDAPAET